ncbi:NAD(P)-dependent oxidoreductase [Niabella drilacis]|uniref:3-hydroxyisobutyrate dehydrogenase n=1 Tax=Niabella drilacis (strain DSM 25811 / CCM 8410 / CCUG 62505 / LMG 26954 / E90) TaxID=1285928 RepID=A0A1G6S3I5_NIADE|nr:NAD(P)-binding domain-containing protein [Niabella drilacis]SDD11243.1 3-hydroxyisobutyrate dehydrogenase [Niabella drilacis]
MKAKEDKISIIGLGPMGVKIAQLYLQKGFQVTVFNRTAAKADPLIKEGAAFVPTVQQAIEASPVSIVIVHDYDVAKKIFAAETGDTLSGRIIVQLTTGTAQEARASEAWFSSRNAGYIDGAIQVAPEQMAQPDTTILFSGQKGRYLEIEDLLKVLGGNLKYLGENTAAAAALDTATLSYIYGAAIGFFHGALIAESENFDVKEYSDIIAEIAPGMGEFLKHEGAVISSGDYRISQSPLSISVGATERILATARLSGINSEFPELAASWLKRAKAAGYENEEFAAVMKTLRN